MNQVTSSKLLKELLNGEEDKNLHNNEACHYNLPTYHFGMLLQSFSVHKHLNLPAMEYTSMLVLCRH